MAIGTSKVGALGGLVPGGTETFNASGTFCVPPGVKLVSIEGAGGTGNPGNPGNAGNPGNPGTGASGGGGGGGNGYGGISAGQAHKYPFPGAFSQPYCNTSVWTIRSTALQAGNVGQSGNAGSVGSAGNPGNSGQQSSGLTKTFCGGAGGNGGNAGNAGNGGSPGSGGNAGQGSLNQAALPTPQSGGSGGNGAGNGGPSNQGPSPRICSWRYGGAGGGGAGTNTNGGPYRSDNDNQQPSGSPQPALSRQTTRGGLNGAGFYNPALNVGCNQGFWGYGGMGRQSGSYVPSNNPNWDPACTYRTPCGVSRFHANQQFVPAMGGNFCAMPANATSGWWRAGGGGGAGTFTFTSAQQFGGGGGGGGGRGNAGNSGGSGGAGNPGSAATPATYNCVPVSPGCSYPITVACGGSITISWNPQ